MMNIFSKNHDQFEAAQNELLELYLSGNGVIKDMNYSSEKLEKLRTRYDTFLDQNSYIDVANNSVENIANERRLYRRKWFTVGADALLGLAAIKFFLSETVNISLSWLPSILLGITIAYILLDMAIEFRIDDNKESENGNFNFIDSIKKWSYIIPISLIPILNFFIIKNTPNNPINLLYIFFAGFTIFLNLKAASYWREFRLLKVSRIAKRKVKVFENEIAKIGQTLRSLSNKGQKIRNELIKKAVKLRSLFEKSPMKEEIKFSLPIEMFLIMNNLIFNQDVFPIPQLSLTSPPPGDLEASLTAWRRGIFTEHTLRLPLSQNEIRGNKVPELESGFNTKQVSVNPDKEIINNNYQTELNQSEVDFEQDSTTIYTGGIPENEKYL